MAFLQGSSLKKAVHQGIPYYNYIYLGSESFVKEKKQVDYL